jgi:hypothetical protein
MRPRGKHGGLNLAIEGSECCIGRVHSVGNFDSAGEGAIMSGIVRIPIPSKVHFNVGMEITTDVAVGAVAIFEQARYMSRYISGRQIERAAQRDNDMCEVTTDAVAPPKYVTSTQQTAAGSVSVLDIGMHPVTDCLHLQTARRKIPEIVFREVN